MLLFLIWAFVFAPEASWIKLYTSRTGGFQVSKHSKVSSLGLDLRPVRDYSLTLYRKDYKIQAL